MKKQVSSILIILCCIFAFATFSACETEVKISFDKDVYTIKVGTEFTPQINITPNDKKFSLSVANNTIAEVKDKTIRGIRTGMTTITATADSVTATAKLIISDITSNIETNEQAKDTHYVRGILVNYEDVGLTTDDFSIEAVFSGTTYLTSPPNISGFTSYGWFTDYDCETVFDPYLNPISQDTTLYFMVKPNENSFALNAENMISGMKYDNLPHAELIFPETIYGKTVTGIADNAFKEDTSVTHVYIPASYTYIGDNAFAGCSNLEVFEIPDDSKLTYIGSFAFSVTSSEVTVVEDDESPITKPVINDNACKKLKTLNLPDSVSEIGNSAFCYCSSLEFDGIPSALTEIPYAAFCETKINNIDFKNVKNIMAYAFKSCPELVTVENTENVEYCEPEAFLDCKLYAQQSNDNFIYVGTMAVGCARTYGVLGGGKIYLNDSTTLIADGVANAAQQNELSVYFNELPNNKLVTIGRDSFLDKVGVCLVVPESLIDEYRKAFPDYREHFCTEYVYEVTDKETDVNLGKHTLLKFSDTKYFYDKFTVYSYSENRNGKTVYKNKSPKEIRFDEFGWISDYIARINTGAINLGEFGGNLTYLDTYKVTEIAPLAIVNCFKLSTIDFRRAQSTVGIGSNSIQFSSVGKSTSVSVQTFGNPNPQVSKYKIFGINNDFTNGISLYTNELSDNEFVYRGLNLISETSIKLGNIEDSSEVYTTVNSATDVNYSYTSEGSDRMITLQKGTYDIYFNSEKGEIRISSSLKAECKILINDKQFSEYSEAWEDSYKTAMSRIITKSNLIF